MSAPSLTALCTQAHRKLALQNHPDKGGDDDKFREIQEAYEKLQKIMKAKGGGARSSEDTAGG